MKGRIRIAIACTGLLLGAGSSARAQTAYRETGSVTVGGYLLWVRGTNAKVVELFVGRGFRDAFAKAHASAQPLGAGKTHYCRGRFA